MSKQPTPDEYESLFAEQNMEIQQLRDEVLHLYEAARIIFNED